jgi:dihydroorotase-like cyclic amidohydrolase
VTSGKFAALKGLPAAPPIAERMGLDRDLALVEMTGVRYHADQLSTAAALPALKRAKAAGLDVTAGCLDPSPDAQRARRRRFPHLLQAQAPAAVRG